MRYITALVIFLKPNSCVFQSTHPIAQSIAVLEGDEEEGTPAICRLDNIVTVVDALRMATEFGCGDNLLKDDVDEEEVKALLLNDEVKQSLMAAPFWKYFALYSRL